MISQPNECGHPKHRYPPPCTLLATGSGFARLLHRRADATVMLFLSVYRCSVISNLGRSACCRVASAVNIRRNTC